MCVLQPPHVSQVAAVFQLTREDLSNWQLLTAAVQQMLTSQSSYKAAVHLLMQFQVCLGSCMYGNNNQCVWLHVCMNVIGSS
jgi:hypothetical protein